MVSLVPTGKPYLPIGQQNVLYDLPAEGVHDYQQPIDPAVVSEVKIGVE
jgi:hypothetical protein